MIRSELLILVSNGVCREEVGYPWRDRLAPWMAPCELTWTYLQRVPERMPRLPNSAASQCTRFGFGFGFGFGFASGFGHTAEPRQENQTSAQCSTINWIAPPPL